MKKGFTKIGLILSILGVAVLGLFFTRSTQATEVCPQGGAWTSHINVNAQSYTYEAPEGKVIVESCYKAGTTLRFEDYDPGEEEVTVQSNVWNKGICYITPWLNSCNYKDISHASFKLENEEAQPSPTPTATPTASPSATPTPSESSTPTPTSTSSEEPTSTPTPEPEDVCVNIEDVQEEVPEGYYEDDGYCYEREESPTPTPSQTPTITSTSTTGAPVCPNNQPILVPTNPHVVRNGTEATVKAHIPEGNVVHIYYKLNSDSGWTHAARDIPVSGNFLEYTIHDLDANQGYTFGIQSANSCAGGETILAVIVDPPAQGVVFPFSFWEWLY